MDDVQFSCSAESRLSLLVSRKSFDSLEFIFLTIVFQLCNGNYKVYLSPIFGRVFKQEIFKSIAYGCRIYRGTTYIKSGAGQVVLADLLPAAGDSAASGRPRCAGWSRGGRVGRRWCAGWGGVREVTIRVAPSNRLQAFADKPSGFLYLLISGEASKAESYRSVTLVRAESHGAQHVRRLWNP